MGNDPIVTTARLVREAETLYERLFDERRAAIGKPADYLRVHHACRRALLRLMRREDARHDAEWREIMQEVAE